MQKDRQTEEKCLNTYGSSGQKDGGSAPSPGMDLTPAWDIFTVFPSLLKPELSPGHGFAPD